MGFRYLFAYAAGKADWMAYGLPVVRADRSAPLVGDNINRDVPRCRPGDSIGAARDAAYATGRDICPVVNEEEILLGICSRVSLHAHPSITAELVMEPAPTTVRPSMPVEDALKMMERKKIHTLLVTNPDGKLLGCFSDATSLGNNGVGNGVAT